MRLMLTSEVGHGMSVGSAARILPCELYYRYTKGVVTASPAALSIAFTLVSSGAHSWRRWKIKRGGFTEEQSVGFKLKSKRSVICGM